MIGINLINETLIPAILAVTAVGCMFAFAQPAKQNKGCHMQTARIQMEAGEWPK